MQVSVNRKGIQFLPDSSRVIARFLFTTSERGKMIIQNVLAMSDADVKATLNSVLRDYSRRHRNISKIFEKNFMKLVLLFQEMNIDHTTITQAKRSLIGSFFTKETSIESAAFFNPSVIEDPDQSEIWAGEKRLIFSFRATGEGHISSLVFRSATIDKDCNLTVDPVGKMLAEAERIKRHVYNKEQFIEQLNEMHEFDKKPG